MQNVGVVAHDLRESFQDVLLGLINCVDLPATNSDSQDVVADIIERFPKMLTQAHSNALAQQLTSQTAQALIMKLRKSSSGDGTGSFTELLLVYADAALDLIVKSTDVTHQVLGDLLTQLMQCEGVAGIDDLVTPRAIGFWISYTEYVQTSCGSSDNGIAPGWSSTSRDRIFEILRACVNRIRWPSSSVTTYWDSEDLERFHDFRSDFQDLVQTASIIFGSQLHILLSSKALSMLNDSDWKGIEASLFTLNALADTSAAHEIEAEASLFALFSSAIFAPKTVTISGEVNLERSKLRCIQLHAFFFQNRPELLAPLLNSLFSYLKNPILGNLVAQVIRTICSTCRMHLLQELHTFTILVIDLIGDDESETTIKEKLLTAVTSIIQAIPTPEAQAPYLQLLVESIHKIFVAGFRGIETNSVGAQIHMVAALTYLGCIGKALQTPEEILPEPEDSSVSSSYWETDQGLSLRSIIKSIIFASLEFQAHGEILEAVCTILRTGFDQMSPGLFAFEPEFTRDVLRMTRPEASRIEYVLDTAALRLSKIDDASRPEAQLVSLDILNHSRQLIEHSAGW